jgi:hypothetical protein
MSRSRSVLLAGVAIALAVAVASAWVASSEPDGLERVATDQAFIEQAEDASYEILPDYTIPGIEDERLSTALAGVAGVLLVLALTMGLGTLLRRREDRRGGPRSSAGG